MRIVIIASVFQNPQALRIGFDVRIDAFLDNFTCADDVLAIEAGIVWGTENGLKTSNRAATRGDVLKALYVAAGSLAVEDTSILIRFKDASSIPDDMAAIAAWAA